MLNCWPTPVQHPNRLPKCLTLRSTNPAAQSGWIESSKIAPSRLATWRRELAAGRPLFAAFDLAGVIITGVVVSGDAHRRRRCTLRRRGTPRSPPIVFGLVGPLFLFHPPFPSLFFFPPACAPTALFLSPSPFPHLSLS